MNTEHRKIESLQEYNQAVDDILRTAEHSLLIFDVNFRGGAYNSPGRVDLLHAFLHRSRANRLTVVLHDCSHLQRECPRLVQLIRLFSHAVGVHETNEEAKSVSDPFIVADNLHALRRFHFDHPRALLSLHDPENSLELSRRFLDIQNASTPIPVATTLGL